MPRSKATSQTRLVVNCITKNEAMLLIHHCAEQLEWLAEQDVSTEIINKMLSYNERIKILIDSMGKRA